MSYVVLDTDVASNALKHRELPGPIVAAILASRVCITFVTLGELTKWAIRRQWGPTYRRRLEAWLDGVILLPVRDEIEDVARIWGDLAGHAENRGRPRPQNDTWVAACCLHYELQLATLNVKDYRDFAEHEGLNLVLS